jgi:hypothetical protein
VRQAETMMAVSRDMPYTLSMTNDKKFPVKKLVQLTATQAKLINDFRYNHRK